MTVDEVVDCPLAVALAERVRADRDELTRRWLDRIAARVDLAPDQIFPTQDLLDHVPRLIEGVADYLEDPADEISADVPVTAKAMEMGEMRHLQGFSLHEILKEHEILGGVLFSHLVTMVDGLERDCSRSELLACAHRIFRAIAVIQQVTAAQYQRLTDERVREREERLRSFNRMVSHELRNRIAAVQGASSLLQEAWVQESPPQRERFVAIVAHSAEAMNALLEDLLSLSRIEGHRQQRNVQLPEAVAEAARQLRAMAQDRGVDLRVEPDLPRVEVDAAAVELCLVNYLSNGIKYSDPGKPERWVQVRAARADFEEGSDEVVIEVADNGIGIPESARPEIFQRFFRAPDVGEVEGTGLGLSIVRETVEAIGGRAWVEFPDDGCGSRFYLAVPARRMADGEGAAEAAPPAPPG